MPNRKSEKYSKNESKQEKETNKTKRMPRTHKNTDAGPSNPRHEAIVDMPVAQTSQSDSEPLYLNLSFNGN